MLGGLISFVHPSQPLKEESNFGIWSRWGVKVVQGLNILFIYGTSSMDHHLWTSSNMPHLLGNQITHPSSIKGISPRQSYRFLLFLQFSSQVVTPSWHRFILAFNSWCASRPLTWSKCHCPSSTVTGSVSVKQPVDIITIKLTGCECHVTPIPWIQNTQYDIIWDPMKVEIKSY